MQHNKIYELFHFGHEVHWHEETVLSLLELIHAETENEQINMHFLCGTKMILAHSICAPSPCSKL